MQSRAAVVLFSLFFATTAFAKDVYLSISGKANGFFTDARILNPSYDKDITVTARYLPVGNTNNSGVASVNLTIPKRCMRIFDDAVQSIFGGGPALGAIRLTSAAEDDFVATQRIYLDARLGPQAGTLGQFVPGFDVTTAKRKGLILQLKSGQSALGTFRTNWGGANPNGVVANVTLKLYDKSNAVVSTKTIAFQPFGVQGPTSIADYFATPSSDISDAWISFESDEPVFLWGSVVDNGSIDPTFIPAADDTGVAPTIPPPQLKTVTVSAFSFAFDVTGTEGLKEGDEVKFLVSATDGPHGFRLFSPGGQILIDLGIVSSTTIEQVITLPASGTYAFLCTRELCGEGHTQMNGAFVVGSPTDPGDRY